jgi:hypothetical protein
MSRFFMLASAVTPLKFTIAGGLTAGLFYGSEHRIMQASLGVFLYYVLQVISFFFG